jgi:glycogen debranching enzyme
VPDLEWSLPAAGLPSFMALFGRDSLLTAYMTLPFQPRLAATTLRALAALQATEDDPYRDAEPSKILDELRRGILAASGPVEYPTASCPQAWAAAAPLLGLRTLLGLDPDADGLRCAPCVPTSLGHLRLPGVAFRGREQDTP